MSVCGNTGDGGGASKCGGCKDELLGVCGNTGDSGGESRCEGGKDSGS